MTKQEVKKAKNHELIRETINTYGLLLMNYSQQRGIKQHEKHFNDCCEEMVKRELITQEDWDYLNK